MEKERMNTKECGKFIDRTDHSVRRLVMRKKIPYRKVAGRLVFFKTELETWMQNSPGMDADEVLKDK